MYNNNNKKTTNCAFWPQKRATVVVDTNIHIFPEQRKSPAEDIRVSRANIRQGVSVTTSGWDETNSLNFCKNDKKNNYLETIRNKNYEI